MRLTFLLFTFLTSFTSILAQEPTAPLQSQDDHLPIWQNASSTSTIKTSTSALSSSFFSSTLLSSSTQLLGPISSIPLPVIAFSSSRPVSTSTSQLPPSVTSNLSGSGSGSRSGPTATSSIELPVSGDPILFPDVNPSNTTQSVFATFVSKSSFTSEKSTIPAVTPPSPVTFPFRPTSTSSTLIPTPSTLSILIQTVCLSSSLLSTTKVSSIGTDVSASFSSIVISGVPSSFPTVIPNSVPDSSSLGNGNTTTVSTSTRISTSRSSSQMSTSTTWWTPMTSLWWTPSVSQTASQQTSPFIPPIPTPTKSFSLTPSIPVSSPSIFSTSQPCFSTVTTITATLSFSSSELSSSETTPSTFITTKSTTSTTSTSISISAPSSASSSSIPSATAPTSNSSSSSGIPSSTIAGIAVASSAATLLFALLILYLLKRHLKSRRRHSPKYYPEHAWIYDPYNAHPPSQPGIITTVSGGPTPHHHPIRLGPTPTPPPMPLIRSPSPDVQSAVPQSAQMEEENNPFILPPLSISPAFHPRAEREWADVPDAQAGVWDVSTPIPAQGLGSGIPRPDSAAVPPPLRYAQLARPDELHLPAPSAGHAYTRVREGEDSGDWEDVSIGGSSEGDGDVEGRGISGAGIGELRRSRRTLRTSRSWRTTRSTGSGGSRGQRERERGREVSPVGSELEFADPRLIGREF